jgi:hypothetical protein
METKVPVCRYMEPAKMQVGFNNISYRLCVIYVILLAVSWTK